LEYATVQPEEKTEDEPRKDGAPLTESGEEDIPLGWPSTGSVEFRDVTIKYDHDGPEILKDVNLKFNAGERVAIIGRTGSGKSTLVLSLLRFTKIVKGTVLYDGVDITHIPRKMLRQGLTIIPQEAVLFNGTVGTNLDPSGHVPPNVLEEALDSCSGIASFQFRGREDDGVDDRHSAEEPRPVEASDERQPLLNGNGASNSNGKDYGTAAKPAESKLGLDLSTRVDARGENFSHGQRQVLSLCRALVRKSKLMLLDEATASMDPETDAGIQAVLRGHLVEDGRGKNERTLVTIAHRLRTIMDYDKVVVMAAGRVQEAGSPRELFDAKGMFYDMVAHSGEVDELEALMDGK